MNRRSLEKYLTKRAVSNPWELTPKATTTYRGAVVIPSLAEGDDLFTTLDSLALSDADLLQQTAIIVVINQRDDASFEQKRINASDLERLNNQISTKKTPSLFVVDAISEGRTLGKKDGVGLARKIGFDLALTLLGTESNPLLISLDADTIVDRSYLASIYRHFSDHGVDRSNLAAEIPFAHRLPDDETHRQAITVYELFLRLHLEGLLLANSPYAFHTIGSAFACTAEAYIKAGGMKLRQGGEDFYFLQQVRKLGSTGSENSVKTIKTIGRVQGTCVQPSARLSTRAPFGTGPALGKIVKEGETSWGFYPLSCYRVLGAWLKTVRDNPDGSADQLLLRAESIDPELHHYLQKINFDVFWHKSCSSHSDPARRFDAFHDWFDGLKSLRLIHHLCERDGRIDVYRSLKEFMPLLSDEDISSPLAALYLLRGRQGVGISNNYAQ